MKQQLIDRNECIAEINRMIEQQEELQRTAYSKGNIQEFNMREQTIEDFKYVRYWAVSKMPIVEEREVEG